MRKLLRPYRGLISLLVVLAILANGSSLLLPRLVGRAINATTAQHGLPQVFVLQFAAIMLTAGLFTALQGLLQTYLSERVAMDLRSRLGGKLSRQSYAFLRERDPARLLTNLTADVDAVKTFVSQGITGLLTSLVVLLGASFMLLRLNWRLGLVVLSVFPLMGLLFASLLKRVRPLSERSREVLDSLNRVIERTIVGAALIRVLNAHSVQRDGFAQVNRQARDVGLRILGYFAFLIPSVSLLANFAGTLILGVGGRLVLRQDMSLGDIAAFLSYVAVMVYPVYVIGFIGGLMVSAQVALRRLLEVLAAPEPEPVAALERRIQGLVEVRDVALSFGERSILEPLSFRLEPGSRTAVVGPTAAGKTHLLHLLSGLLSPDRGSVLYDGEYPPQVLSGQIGVVFQESALFRGSVKDNVAFLPMGEPDESAWRKALRAAELEDFVAALPEGEHTLVSERGTTLSGGQKQRLTLARALVLQPAVLLLDDFTAHLDSVTETRIRNNLEELYPGMTVLAVTQRIRSVAEYDQILLLMEGQLLAQGTHHELLQSSPEYAQIYESQKSTHHHE